MEGPAERASGAIRSILSNRMVWIWAGVWVATRVLIVANVGFWDESRPAYYLEDVNRYREWSEILATEGAIPDEDSWQYPLARPG